MYKLHLNLNRFCFSSQNITSDHKRLSANRNITKGNKLLIFSIGDKRIIKTYDIFLVQNKQKCMRAKKKEKSQITL
jgi:hypothetical protein